MSTAARREFGAGPLSRVAALVYTLLVVELLLLVCAAPGLVALFALPAFAVIALLPVAAPAERLAHLGAVGLVTIYSFLAHKHVTFAGGLLIRLNGRATVVS